jgi:hypothetical protein
MRYKIIYILLIISSLYSQSFFNRVIPEELYFNDAKSMAIGQTMISTGNGSGMVISNPAILSNHKDGFYVDMNAGFISLSERRSIIFKDNWDEVLGETDYVFNQNNSFSHGFGLIYNKTLDKFKISGAFTSKPYLSLNYDYEEEIRGDSNLDDGIIGINDPIVGYQTFSTSGDIDITSIGVSFSLLNNKKRNFSFGISLNNILDTRITDEIKKIIVDDSFHIENMPESPVVNTSYLIESDRLFHTIGFQVPVSNELVLTLSYEENVMIENSNTNFIMDVSNIVGLPQLFGYDNGELSYLMEGFSYQKPQKKNLGIVYYPKSNINMLLAFEVLNKSWTINIPGTDRSINEYKLGFEYAPYNSYPIRAGLVYKESIFDMIEAISVLTLGTGMKIGKVELDLVMNYSTFSYKYFDIFPLEDIYSLSCDIVGCDNVTENRLSFLTTIKMEF